MNDFIDHRDRALRPWPKGYRFAEPKLGVDRFGLAEIRNAWSGRSRATNLDTPSPRRRNPTSNVRFSTDNGY